MNSARLACWTAAALAVVVGAARAEVRLAAAASGEGLQVEVVTTMLGPWTPTGPVSAVVLNPVGDLTGDSMPGWANGSLALAAWNRPVTGTLDQAIGSAGGWQRLPARTLPGTFGTPLVDPLTGGWTVTVQVVDPTGPHVRIFGTTPTGLGTEVKRVGSGQLLGTVRGGSITWVLVLHPASGRIGATPAWLSYVPTQPIPIEIVLGREILLGQTAPCAACSDLQSRAIESRPDEGGTLLTWWSSDTDLESAFFPADGSAPPVVETLPGVRRTERRRFDHSSSLAP